MCVSSDSRTTITCVYMRLLMLISQVNEGWIRPSGPHGGGLISTRRHSLRALVAWDIWGRWRLQHPHSETLTATVSVLHTWLPPGRWVCSWDAGRTRLSSQSDRCWVPSWSPWHTPSTYGSTGRFPHAYQGGCTWAGKRETQSSAAKSKI